MLALLAAPAIVAPPAAAQPTQVTAAERCQALEGGALADLPSAPTQITRAVLRPATADKPAVCAIEGYVSPVVNFGLLMPAEGWNGRYLVRGCGGSCGVVAVDLACASHVRDGYACLHTDMGHRSTLSDNNWVKDNLSGLVDFGYRATHVTTKAGRAVLRAYYGADPRKSYFFACSTGGRQGLIEAQRFPDDFDGIVAIAPASMAPFGNSKPATISDIDAFNTRPDGRPILPNRKALLLHRAAVRQCDKGDGIVDGIIGKPLQCRFRPAQLLCKNGEEADCLSADQVAVADKLYGWRGAMPGSEFNWIGNFIRNAPLPGEDWQPLFDLGVGRGDPVVIETMIAPNNPDLRPFKARGGKLILVHGWSDFSTMPPPTVDYYETVTRTMGGPQATRDFARLYMIPGMDHCSGGDGAWAVNYMAAITDWVEKNEAPDALRGIKPVPGAPLDYFAVDLPLMDRKFIAFERDHRAWPSDSVAVKSGAAPSAPPAAMPLDQALLAALQHAEQTGTKAGYPRRSTLNLVLKTLWETLYRTNRPADEQRAALAAIPVEPLTPLGREAVARMQAEQTLD
ncbi:tannase/feruloyl esterase family alpha/beta hydrolase [Blastomonas fulva]|uniref:tannase/feruloyl esterase family alpha/beta hydrolase n=1 Tax=Blastomonas fulva TaxID=1550728 RepID=UPI003F6F26B3